MSDAKNEVVMERDGVRTEVSNDDSVEVMEKQGWSVVGADTTKKPSDGLNVDQIKAALAERKIVIPDGTTKKADLAALLDAAPAAPSDPAA